MHYFTHNCFRQFIRATCEHVVADLSYLDQLVKEQVVEQV